MPVVTRVRKERSSDGTHEHIAGVCTMENYYYTRAQANTFSSTNQEVTGYTELVHGVRSDAREQFARRAARQGGDASVISDISLSTWSTENNGHRDHVAQCFVTGTCLTSFAQQAATATPTLSVLPLTTTSMREQS